MSATFGTIPSQTATRNYDGLENPPEYRLRRLTKDEDPTGLLDEGFRYRDLDTGSFITKDPLGFVDGPNLYTYVVDNPWTHFDPEGLATEDDYQKQIDQAQGDRQKAEHKFNETHQGMTGEAREKTEKAYTDPYDQKNCLSAKGHSGH